MLRHKLGRDNDQIFMTLNGHQHGAVHLTKTNAFGNPVYEIVDAYSLVPVPTAPNLTRGTLNEAIRQIDLTPSACEWM